MNLRSARSILLSGVVGFSACQKSLSPDEFKVQMLSSSETVRKKAIDQFKKQDLIPEERRSLVNLLSDAAKDNPEMVRRYALESLAAIGGEVTAAHRTQVVTNIMMNMSDPAAPLRASAVSAAGSLGLHELEPFVVNALGDGDPTVRRFAVQTIAQLIPESAPYLLYSAQSDSDPAVSAAVREVLKGSSLKRTPTKGAGAAPARFGEQSKPEQSNRLAYSNRTRSKSKQDVWKPSVSTPVIKREEAYDGVWRKDMWKAAAFKQQEADAAARQKDAEERSYCSKNPTGPGCPGYVEQKRIHFTRCTPTGRPNEQFCTGDYR